MPTLRTSTLLSCSLLALIAAGCGDAPLHDAQEQGGADALVAPQPLDAREVMIEPADADPDVFPGRYMADAAAVERFFAEGGRIAPGSPFVQINWLYDAASALAPRYRVRGLDGRWGAWREAEVTWAEGVMHNARALLDAPAVEVELERMEGLTLANVELPARRLVDVNAPLTRTLPRVGAVTQVDDQFRSVGRALAPSTLVIPRNDWGARNPSKICGDVVAPYRATVHHTASPDSDGADPAARLRQMQAYHIDNNGWCDIGYHFVVSQSGKIYQGRSDERRPGAHTGNQNSGNIGVSMIGNYEANPLVPAQVDAVIRILSWIKQTYPGIVWTRDFVKGHQEWPGQSTACPGKNFMARIDEVVASAGGAVVMPSAYDVNVSVRYLDGKVADFHASGESEGIGDVLPGDKIKAEIVVSNRSAQPLRGVKVDYLIEQPFVRATGYKIQTDYPAKDGATWMLNDADAAPENPARDAMGARGTLSMYAFGAGESKRVLIELEAAQYSIGAIDHPDVRGWVRHIDDVYGEQTEWDQAPSVNKIEGGAKLQGFAQVDVLAPDQWSFDGAGADNLEGWTDCAPEQSEGLSNSGGVLSQRIKGADACVASSAWTAIDADRWDQLVLKVRSASGAHKSAIYWARDGEPFSEARRVRFEAPGDGTMRTLVVPIGDHPQWSGSVVNLRLDLLDEAPQAGAVGVYDVDAVYLQSAARGVSNVVGVPFQEGRPVALLGADDKPATPMDPPDRPDVDPGTPGEGDGAPGDDVAVNSGCSSAPGAAPNNALWLLALAGLIWRGRRPTSK